MVLVPEKARDLPDDEFGEGLSPINESEFAVLTWRERVIHILDRETMTFSRKHTLPGEINEGWGITADESQPDFKGCFPLYVSDGSDTIFKV